MALCTACFSSDSNLCCYESLERGITVDLVSESVLAVGVFALYLGNDLCARCYLGAEHTYASYAALYLMVPGVYATTPVLAA
jgi:hypothetical protein